MEIKDYLRILGRRIRILILVPLLALAAVVGYTLVQPKQYQAVATVAAPALVGGATANQYSGANGLKAFVGNFTAAVTSPQILDQVRTETHVAKGRLKSGVSAQQVGTSSLMRVTYKTPIRRQAAPVVRAVAADTMTFLFRMQVQLAQQPVDAARKGVADSEAAIADLTKKVGSVPDKAYEIKADQITHLQDSVAQANAVGNPTSAARYQAAINANQAQLADMAPMVQQYQSLVDQKNQAYTTLNQAQQNLRQAQAQFEAADPSRVVTVGKTQPVSIVADLAQKSAVALAAGLFLALGIVVVLEFLLSLRGETAESAVSRRPAPSGA